jgi:hypothetical protein
MPDLRYENYKSNKMMEWIAGEFWDNDRAKFFSQ